MFHLSRCLWLLFSYDFYGSRKIISWETARWNHIDRFGSDWQQPRYSQKSNLARISQGDSTGMYSPTENKDVGSYASSVNADDPSYFRNWRSLVNAQLEMHLPAPNEPTQLVRSAMNYAVKGGHRWRPILLISAYEGLTAKSGLDVIDAACAIELIHCCTIILDDLPCIDDNAILRRGRPSCHTIYGEAITIYASHLLYALAERLSYENATRLQVDGKSVWYHLAELRQRLVEVQLLEINLNQKAILPSDDALMKFYELKSSPFVSAAWLAATLGNVEETERENLIEYAGYLGMAYQLADDILDVQGEPSMMGKPAGKDRDKVNYITQTGINHSKQLMRQFLTGGERMLNVISGDTTALHELMRQIIGPVLHPNFV